MNESRCSVSDYRAELAVQPANSGVCSPGNDSSGALVVLAGGQNIDGSPSDSSVTRCRAAARLFNTGSYRTIVVTGGASNRSEGPPLAFVMADLLADLGVPSTAMVIDEASWSTRTSALACGRLLRNATPPFVLVTTGSHLRRAMGAFRGAGIAVVGYPVECGSSEQRRSSTLKRLLRSESVKLLYYFCRGWLRVHQPGGTNPNLLKVEG